VSKPSITEQREAIEALINGAIQDEPCSPSDIEAAKEAVATIGFIERNTQLARAITIIMQEFPDAKFAGVR